VRNSSIDDLLQIVGSYVQDWLLFDTDVFSTVVHHGLNRNRGLLSMELRANFAQLRTVFSCE